jgi:hypothetical protein
MLYAQIDSVYAAIQALGHTDIDVKISESPAEDRDEAGHAAEAIGAHRRLRLRAVQREPEARASV